MSTFGSLFTLFKSKQKLSNIDNTLNYSNYSIDYTWNNLFSFADFDKISKNSIIKRSSNDKSSINRNDFRKSLHNPLSSKDTNRNHIKTWSVRHYRNRNK